MSSFENLQPDLLRFYWKTDEAFIQKTLHMQNRLLQNEQAAQRISQILACLQAEDVSGAHERILELMNREQDAFSRGMVTPAVLACALPECIERLHAKGLDDQVLKDTFSDIGLWLDFFRKREGFDGVDELPWVLRPYAGLLLTFGRLMFERKVFAFPFRVYRSRSNGSLHILAEGGLEIAPSGQFSGALSRPKDTAFVTRFEEDGCSVCAHPVNTADGSVSPEQVRLSLQEYRCILAPGMPMLNVHIPEGGKLLPELADAAFDQAQRYFTKQGYPAEIYMCKSWMLDARLRNLLPETSNILAFADRFLRFPVDMDHYTAPKYVFGPAAAALPADQWPAETGFQRRLRDYLQNGGLLFDTAGILLREA